MSVMTKLRRHAGDLYYWAMPTVLLEARKHRRVHGRPLPLLRPRTFNEKIFWSKVFVRDPRMVVCADKYAVRRYVLDRTGDASLLTPLLLVTGDPGDLQPERIVGDRFVVKVNHDCGGVLICRDRAAFDFDAARRTLAGLLRRSWSARTGEWHYGRIRPRLVLVEPLLVDRSPGDLRDYKFLCFGGRVEALWVDSDRFGDHRRDFFDRRWRRLPVACGYPVSARPPARPEALGRMLEIAEALAAGFDFVRVDLYDTTEGVRFGEMTFHPTSGVKKFEPESFDLELGDLLAVRGTGLARWLPLDDAGASRHGARAGSLAGRGAAPLLRQLDRAE